jgi:signal transduction histidine kinase
MNETPLQERPISLASVVESVVASLTEAASEKHLLLDAVIEIGPDAIAARIDEDRMRQVITNLITNAIKGTQPPGKIEVRVTRETSPDRIVVAVIDSGSNLPPNDDLQRLFEPYYRAQSRQAEDGEGQALGLSIAKTLVELHDGHMWAEHNDRGGLTIAFDLAPVPLEFMEDGRR